MATASKVIYYNTEYGDYNHMFDGAPDIITEDLLPILPSPFFGIKHTGWYTSPTFEENTKVTAGYNLTDITLTLYAKWESVPCLVQGESLRSIAETIREKAGTNEKLEFPNGFVNAINNMKNSYDTCTLQIHNGVGGMRSVYGTKVENGQLTHFEFIDNGYNSNIVIENVLCNSTVVFEHVYSGCIDPSIYNTKNCIIIRNQISGVGVITVTAPPGGITNVLTFNQK